MGDNSLEKAIKEQNQLARESLEQQRKLQAEITRTNKLNNSRAIARQKSDAAVQAANDEISKKLRDLKLYINRFAVPTIDAGISIQDLNLGNFGVDEQAILHQVDALAQSRSNEIGQIEKLDNIDLSNAIDVITGRVLDDFGNVVKEYAGDKQFDVGKEK